MSKNVTVRYSSKRDGIYCSKIPVGTFFTGTIIQGEKDFLFLRTYDGLMNIESAGVNDCREREDTLPIIYNYKPREVTIIVE